MTFRKIIILIAVMLAHGALIFLVFLSQPKEEGDKPVETSTPSSSSETTSSNAGRTTTSTSRPGSSNNTERTVVPSVTRPNEIVHIIQKGELLSKIARKYKISVSRLCEHNNITNPNKIRLGQKLKIPKE